MNREVKGLVKALRKAGHRVELTNNGHLRIDDGKGTVVYTGSTPSDPRSVKNACLMLQRAGFKFVYRGKKYYPRNV